MNITIDRAVIEQALEALDEIIKWYGARDKEEVLMAPHNQNPEIKQAMEVVFALRTALEQPQPVQVSPLEFTHMVIDKEDMVGKPIFWAEWPNKE